MLSTIITKDGGGGKKGSGEINYIAMLVGAVGIGVGIITQRQLVGEEEKTRIKADAANMAANEIARIKYEAALNSARLEDKIESLKQQLQLN